MNEQLPPYGPVEPTVRQHSPGPWRWNDAALYCAELDAVHRVDGVMKTCQECGHDPSECGPPVLIVPMFCNGKAIIHRHKALQTFRGWKFPGMLSQQGKV